VVPSPATSLVLLATSLYFYFFGQNSFSENNIDFKIDGPAEIKSGELVSYKISYTNRNVMALLGAKLVFFYPPNAVVSKDGNIVNTFSEDIDIGDLASDESGEKILTAYIVGDQGNIKTARATLSFQPANVRSTFKKEIQLNQVERKMCICSRSYLNARLEILNFNLLFLI